jgi:hypothetical protein
MNIGQFFNSHPLNKEHKVVCRVIPVPVLSGYTCPCPVLCLLFKSASGPSTKDKELNKSREWSLWLNLSLSCPLFGFLKLVLFLALQIKN